MIYQKYQLSTTKEINDFFNFKVMPFLVKFKHWNIEKAKQSGLKFRICACPIFLFISF